jgi:hypothetical protein
MVRRPVFRTAPAMRVRNRLKVGRVNAAANPWTKGRAMAGIMAMRASLLARDGVESYPHFTSKRLSFVDA